MYGYIYKTTNLINGKIYIGQHKSEEYDSSYYGSGKLIRRAIEKYGIENFSNTVLCCCDSKQELNKMEKQLIKNYNSRDIKIGYNIISFVYMSKSSYVNTLNLKLLPGTKN